YGWDVLSHPLYSLDIAPCAYHLYRALQHSLKNKEFDSLEEIKSHLTAFFEGKPKSFNKCGIFYLSEK
ncbi:hypothetical protein EAI_11385, partial [Harpegnathos saltator]